MNVKMTSLNILNLVSFILTILMTNTQAKLIHLKTELNGDELNKNDATDVQNKNQLVRPRRKLSEPTDWCYTQFFAGNPGQPPSGFRETNTNIKYICQQDDTGKYVYSTMFDLNYGIPVYSAYVVSQAQAKLFGTAKRNGTEEWRQDSDITKQARKETYKGQSTYDKGHLVPAETYSFTDAHMLSTFTFTNAVPQISGFNSGKWRDYEDYIRKYATNECGPNDGDLYLITGISEVSLQMGTSGLEAIQNIPLKPLKRSSDNISIPRSMWTAGCCINSTGVLGAFAVIGNNLKDKRKVFMSQVEMTKLQDFLLIGVNGFGGEAINLFPANAECSDPGKSLSSVEALNTTGN